jgi:hypothetical protein
MKVYKILIPFFLFLFSCTKSENSISVTNVEELDTNFNYYRVNVLRAKTFEPLANYQLCFDKITYYSPRNFSIINIGYSCSDKDGKVIFKVRKDTIPKNPYTGYHVKKDLNGIQFDSLENNFKYIDEATYYTSVYTDKEAQIIAVPCCKLVLKINDSDILNQNFDYVNIEVGDENFTTTTFPETKVFYVECSKMVSFNYYYSYKGVKSKTYNKSLYIPNSSLVKNYAEYTLEY